jgi:hypothetical protein
MQLNGSQVAYFQDMPAPAGTELAGWAALVHTLGFKAPMREPSCISEKHVGGSQRMDGPWRVFDKRYKAGGDVTDHLTFALRHEAIDLLVFKRALEAVPAEAITDFVRDTPTGAVARRLWFFYELLTGKRLDLDDAQNVAAPHTYPPLEGLALA